MKIGHFSLFVCAPFALLMTACTQRDVDVFPVSIEVDSSVSSPSATQLASSPRSSRAPASATLPLASSVVFAFPGRVHEIEVVKCGSPSATIDEHCSCNATSVAWLTGAGKWDWAPNQADEPRQQAPLITSGVHYGVQPAGAGYQSDPEQLSDGRYCVHVSVFGECNEGYGTAACIQNEAEGSNYFDVVDSSVITH